MGWVKGLEPSTLGTTIRCSNQLSYTHHIHVMTAIAVFVVRAEWQGRLDSNQRMSASKADALPLGDAPVFAAQKGSFRKERAATLQMQRVTEQYGVGKGTRTLDPRNHNPLL